jgi:hypothetical protein
LGVVVGQCPDLVVSAARCCDSDVLQDIHQHPASEHAMGVQVVLTDSEVGYDIRNSSIRPSDRRSATTATGRSTRPP